MKYVFVYVVAIGFLVGLFLGLAFVLSNLGV
jgi:hypothetical protein